MNNDDIFYISQRISKHKLTVEVFKCPKCKSLDVWKYGFEYYNGDKKQRYKCKNCGHVCVEK